METRKGKEEGRLGINAGAQKRSSRQLIDVFHSISLHPMKTVTRFLTFFLAIFSVHWLPFLTWWTKSREWRRKLRSVRWITSCKKGMDKKDSLWLTQTAFDSAATFSSFLYRTAHHCKWGFGGLKSPSGQRVNCLNSCAAIRVPFPPLLL